jgi:hypothetical protein
MPTVSVTDVFTRVREVEVPSYCPGGNDGAKPCGSDLRAPGALRVWEWNDASWSARLGTIDEESADEVMQGGVLVDANTGSERGECWIEHITLYCCACGACIAQGEWRQLDSGATSLPNIERDRGEG